MPRFRQSLQKINRFLHSITVITLRPKPEIRLIYLNGKGGPTTQKTAPTLVLKAHIIDKSDKPRKIVQIGDSFFVSHKQGWLNKVARHSFDDDRKPCRTIDSQFLLLDDDKYGILLTTPEEEET